MTATTSPPSARSARKPQPVVEPDSPRWRRPSNAGGRNRDGHRAVAARPADTANTHPGRLRATVHNGVAGGLDTRTDHQRRACSGATRHGHYIRHPVCRDTAHRAATGTDDRCQRAPGHDAAAAHHARAHQRQPRITPAVSQPDSAPEERTGRRATRRPSLADGSRHAGSQEAHSIPRTPSERSR